MEALRESQKRKNEEKKQNGALSTAPTNGAVLQKASAWAGSWGTWVGEKRKIGWGRTASTNQPPWVKKEKEKENVSLPVTPSAVPLESEKGKERPQSYNESLFDVEALGDSALDEVQRPEELKPEPHPAPSTSHIAPEPTPAAVPEPEPVSASEETKAWGEDAKPAVDMEARSQAVAEAVEAATTPILR